MQIEPENQEQEKKPATGQDQQGINNEELAKEIPTVTPDDDNLEPGPEEEETM